MSWYKLIKHMLAHYFPINYRIAVSYKKTTSKSTTLGILLNLTSLGPDQLDYVFNPTEQGDSM